MNAHDDLSARLLACAATTDAYRLHATSEVIREAAAALAAPKEAGDDWADVALCLSNDVLPPMECPDTPDRWLAAMRRRLAAPSKEAGAVVAWSYERVALFTSGAHDWTHALTVDDPRANYPASEIRNVRPLYAAPQADQQGIIAAAANLYDNRLGWSDGRNPYAARELWDQLGRALGRPESGFCEPPSDQQGASLEGALRAYMSAQRRMLGRWADGDDNVKRDLWRNLHACEAAAEAALASKASPDDQRQEGEYELAILRATNDRLLNQIEQATATINGLRAAVEALSPPTEGEWKIGDRVQWTSNFGARFPATITRINPATYDADLDDGTQAENYTADRFAALSPTASAAREGSDG